MQQRGEEKRGHCSVIRSSPDYAVPEMLMQMRMYTPVMPLSLFVDCFWYLSGYRPAHARELTLPDGSVEIVIDLRGGPIRLFDREDRALDFGGAVLCGPHSDYFIIDTADEAEVVGIHFKPGGANPFLNLPLHELHNAHVSLDLLWGASARELREELLEAATVDDKFGILERRLMALAAVPQPSVRYALEKLRDSSFTGTVADVVGEIGMSHSRFNQIYKAEVGMSQKRSSRLFRFQQVLRLIGSGREIDWSEVALHCGYYDQAHFIKDFQSFSGINPSAYRSLPGRHHNHAVYRA
jgi:AraC-like DNA-binding protein